MKNVEQTLKGLVANHAAHIDEIEHESVHTYCFIRDQYAKTADLTKNYLFQFVFRSFYRLDSAGLTSDYKKRFFEVMQNYRDKELSIMNIQADFADISSRRLDLEGKSAFQGSFISKMIHTIDDTFPIYDSNVATVFEIKPYIYNEKTSREEYYGNMLNELKAEYLSVTKSDLFHPVRKAFNEKFNVDVSDTKLVDFLVWEAGDKLKKEAKVLRDQRREERASKLEAANP